MADPISDVVRPWVNGLDLAQAHRETCGSLTLASICLKMKRLCTRCRLSMCSKHVKPEREQVSERLARTVVAVCDDLARKCASALTDLNRYHRYATRREASHLCLGRGSTYLADRAIVVFARDDDYFFGVLHSRVHEALGACAWARNCVRRERLPLHPHHHLRDLPLPLAARAGAGGRSARRGDRRGGAGAGGAARRVAEPGRRERGGAEEAHADQPVQRAADLAGPGASEAGCGGARCVWVAARL